MIDWYLGGTLVSSSSQAYTVAGGNGVGSGANQLHYPSGIALDVSGNLYVANFTDGNIGTVTKITPDGSSVSTFADNGMSAPLALAFDLKAGVENLDLAEGSAYARRFTGFPITIPSGTTTDLSQVAAAIDAVGGSVQAKVVQDSPGNYQLRVWDSRGQPLNVDVSGGTMGTNNLGSYLGMKQAHLVQATVIPDGSGYRLRIRQSNDQELYVGATPDNATPPGSIITDLGLQVSATRSAGNLSVRTDIQGSPSLVACGAMQYNADLGKYALSEGDNTTALAMAKTMGTKAAMGSAGDMFAGSYTFAEYASASISVVSTNASHSKDQQSYQTSLGQSLNSQYTSSSGVNLDEEVANMINFQQAYSASAKVISTLQQMLDTLVNIIH